MTLRHRLFDALVVGLVIATGFAILSVVLWFSGARVRFESRGVSLHEVVGLYYAGALMGSILVGLCWPIHRRLLGSLVLGWIGVLPSYIGAAWLVAPEGISSRIVVAIALVALATGGGPASALWWQKRKQT